MRKGLFIFIWMLTWMGAFGKPSFNPYHYYAIDFNNLLPFSTEELFLIKKNKIRLVEIHIRNFRNLHHFNERGVLTHTESYIVNRKKKQKFESHTTYEVDKEGRFTSINEIGVSYNVSDSIAYDSLGRVIYYHSYLDMHEGRKISDQKFIEARFQLEKQTDKFVILVDSSSSNKVYYTVNNLNEVIKTQTDSRTDSISVTHYDTDVMVKSYWLKERDDSVFHLGQKITFRKNRIYHKKVYSAYPYGDSICYQSNLYYNENNQLIRQENKRGPIKVETYVYHRTGLLNKVFMVNKNSSAIKSYLYKY